MKNIFFAVHIRKCEYFFIIKIERLRKLTETFQPYDVNSEIFLYRKICHFCEWNLCNKTHVHICINMYMNMNNTIPGESFRLIFQNPYERDFINCLYIFTDILQSC